MRPVPAASEIPSPTTPGGASPHASWRLLALAAFFSLSGLASLIDQVVWLRFLGLVFGNTTHAAATLLAVFLGGLGLGAVLFGRLADRLRRPLVPYALIELAVAAYALATPRLFAWASAGYVALWQGLGPQTLGFALGRALLAALVLLPPTVLMGGTLPLLLRAAVREGRGVGFATSLLYATNTLGAVIGVALAGFVTIRLLGLQASLQVAATANLVAAAGCLVLSRPLPARPAPANAAPVATPRRRWLLAIVFAMGATSLALEVLWTRILVFYLGSSVYAFSLMLVLFLLGVGGGSLLGLRLADRSPRPLLLLAMIELALAFWPLATVAQFSHLNRTLAAVADGLGATDFTGLVIAQMLAVAPILLPPTLLMGLSFPLAVRALGATPEHLGRDAGAVYGANTVGSVVGSLGAGFLLIPLVGTQNALLVVGAINAALAALLLGRGLPAGARWPRLVWLAPLVLLLLAPLLPAHRVILAAGIFAAERSEELVHFYEDVQATVTVRELGSPSGRYHSLELNGVNVAGTSPDLYAVQKMQGHLPLLLRAAPAPDVVHIGFGSGGTAWAVARHPVAAIHIVEISPAVLATSDRFFPAINHGVLGDPRVTTTIADGRNFLLASPDRFDVLLSDSIHPRFAGNGALYSREYFALARERLRPGGTISMWLPTYSLRTADYAMILRAFAEVFPHTTVWYEPSALNAFTIVTGSLGQAPWQPATLAAAFADPAVAGELADLGIRGPADVLLCYLTGGEPLRRWLARFPPHVDDWPAVEYASGTVLLGEATWLETFDTLLALRPAAPPADYLAALDAGETERTRAGWASRRALLRAHRDSLAAQLAAELAGGAATQTVH